MEEPKREKLSKSWNGNKGRQVCAEEGKRSFKMTLNSKAFDDTLLTRLKTTKIQHKLR